MMIDGEGASHGECRVRRTARLKLRNLSVQGGRTSVKLERSLWEAFDEVKDQADLTSSQLARRINAHRPADVSLTSAVRSFIVAIFRLRLRDQSLSHAEAIEAACRTMAESWSKSEPRP